MADKFVWSGATGANDGSTWEDAYVSLMRDWGVEAGFTAGTDFVFVRDSHAESTAAALALVGNTAESTEDPVRILCVVGADTGTAPGNLSSTASVTTTSLGNITIDEKLYVNGVDFFCDNDLNIGSSGFDSSIILENCRLELTGVSGADFLQFGTTSGIGQSVSLIDTDIDFAINTQGIRVLGGNTLWDGGTIDIAVTQLLESFSGRQFNILIRNVDLSLIANRITRNTATGTSGFIRLSRCLMNAAVTEVLDTIIVPAFIYQSDHSQSGTDSDPSFQHYRKTYQGEVESDTARFRTDGASDGERTNPYSISMDTTNAANVIELYESLHTFPIAGWTDGDGSTSHTYRIYIASGATLQDDEVWFDLTGPNDAATDSLGVRKSTRLAPLGTPANITTDGVSTWNGTDVGTLQQMDITYTPDKPGPITAQIHLAKPTERVSIDPKIYIDP